MNRRHWLRSLVAAALTLLPFYRATADQQQADLEETLKFGLKCRRAEEFAFVDLVVQKVGMGQIPRDMVLSQFNWARKQNAKIPFPYFQFGIRKRAAAIGVDL